MPDLTEFEEIQSKARTDEAIAKGLDPDLVEMQRLAASLHDKGVDFTIQHGKVIHARGADRDREVTIDIGSQHIRLGVVSDTHFGSKFEQLSALRHFYRYADDQGVHAFVHAGDLTQGPDRMHRGMEHEVHAHGADAQVAYTTELYPRSTQPDVLTYIITGNHDDSFFNDNGTNVVRQVAGKRPDIVYVGQDAAYLNIGGARFYVLHPDGGGAYAKSYKLQKMAIGLPLEPAVTVGLIGHFHVYGSTREKDTHMLSLPCFQAQYSWLARKGLYPDIGGVILDVWLDDNGKPARIGHELVSYRPTPDDYDRDVSHAVSRAWSANEHRTG